MPPLLAPKNSISLHAGESRTLKVTVTDAAGAAVDLTGATVFLTVKDDLDDVYPMVFKSSADVAQAAITIPRKGIVEFYLVPADTNSTDHGKYLYDVWVQLASGRRYSVIAPSIFEVVQSATRLS